MPSVVRTAFVVTSAALLLAACGSSPDYRASTDKGGGTYKVGKPYQVAGRWYYPKEDPTYDQVGIASWYGRDFHGRHTANGERYDMNDLTAAHTTLPMPTYVRVTNLENGRSLILRVNDRGPFVKDRIIDVSRRAAQLLGFDGKGTAKVRVQVVAPDGSPLTYVATAQQENVGPAVPAVPPEKVDVASLDEPTAPTASPAQGQPPAATPAKEKVFIQAGAFSTYDNAQRLAARLKDLATVELSLVRLSNGPLYRVRLGPLASMSEANDLLGHVVARGHGKARIVID